MSETEHRVEHGYTDPHTGQVYGPCRMDFGDLMDAEEYARTRAAAVGGEYVRRLVTTITEEWGVVP